MATVTYGKVLPEHRSQVEKLHTELFPVVYADSFYDSLFSYEMVTVVAEDKGCVVGVVTARVVEKRKWCCKAVKAGYVSTFGVKEEYRRHKIGTELLNRAIDLLSECNCTTVNLHVLTDNFPAINFYVKCGFKTTQLIESYYLINNVYFDAYSMARDLHVPSPCTPNPLLAYLPFWLRNFVTTTSTVARNDAIL